MLNSFNFNPRAPCGARPDVARDLLDGIRHFNPRAPCGARLIISSVMETPRYFNPRAPCGARLHDADGRKGGSYFNPRAPCGARPCGAAPAYRWHLFQSTRPLRGATLITDRTRADVEFQSTRPLRGATQIRVQRRYRHRISIHAPLAGRDFPKILLMFPYLLFQSTRPLRGATTCAYTARYVMKFQSTRPLRGATLTNGSSPAQNITISIHAPLAGRDRNLLSCSAWLQNFNPRAPCGARQHRPQRAQADHRISIHAPLAGRDGYQRELLRRYSLNFNPRAPCGARQQTCTKNMYMFVRTDKRNSFPCRTLSVRAPDEKL